MTFAAMEISGFKNKLSFVVFRMSDELSLFKSKSKKSRWVD